MATNTYVALDKITVGTATTSVTFSSIPSSYTDLVLVFNTSPAVTAGVDILMTFNSDTASNYSRTYVLGNGSSAVSGRDSNQTSYAPGGIYNNSLHIIQIPNYSNTTTGSPTVSDSGSNKILVFNGDGSYTA